MLADLDELVMKCRDERARKYIDEAVRCYRSGAYRSAVVSTWIAVCFDIVDKVRELASSGDAHAEAVAQEVAKHVASGDIAASLKFEANIPELAFKFEFVSATERIDLARLKIDRNRCAHPSQNNDAEVFDVPSELARLHIRNAVCHLLQHEPAQGKAVLERLWTDIQSATFPVAGPKVLDRLKAGPLKRARQALIRNFVLILLKNIFQGASDYKLDNKIQKVLSATREMHPEIWDKTVRENVGVLTDRAITEDQILRVVRAFDQFQKVLWEFLTPVQQERFQNFVRNASFVAFDGLESLNDEIFVGARESRYGQATREDILDSLFFVVPQTVQERAIRYLEISTSFSDANKFLTFFHTNAIDFNKATIDKLIQAAAKNRQAYDANGFPILMKKFAGPDFADEEFVLVALRKHGLGQIADAIELA